MIASEVFLLCAGSTSQAPKKGKAGGETSRLQQGGFKHVDVLSFPETSQDFWIPLESNSQTRDVHMHLGLLHLFDGVEAPVLPCEADLPRAPKRNCDLRSVAKMAATGEGSKFVNSPCWSWFEWGNPEGSMISMDGWPLPIHYHTYALCFFCSLHHGRALLYFWRPAGLSLQTWALPISADRLSLASCVWLTRVKLLNLNSDPFQTPYTSSGCTGNDAPITTLQLEKLFQNLASTFWQTYRQGHQECLHWRQHRCEVEPFELRGPSQGMPRLKNMQQKEHGNHQKPTKTSKIAGSTWFNSCWSSCCSTYSCIWSRSIGCNYRTGLHHQSPNLFGPALLPWMLRKASRMSC